MSLSEIFYYLFALTCTSYILHLGFYLVGASFYDMWFYRQKSRRTAEPATRLPHVTVLVPAHNEEKVIVRCLASIYRSTYRNIDVIVVNDASTDQTKRILQDYKASHKNQSLRIINKYKNGGKGGGLNYALRTYVTSELVMMVDADSIISPRAIENAVAYFDDSKIVGVAANVQIMNKHTTLSVLQKFEHMIGYRSKKAYSITNCEFVIGGVASTYRTDVIRSVGFYDTDSLTEDIGLSMKIIAKGNKANRIVYGADIMALTEPVESFRGLMRQRYRWKYGSLQNLLKHSNLIQNNDPKYSFMLTIYRMPMAIISELFLLLLPLLWVYALLLTFSEKSLLLIIGAYTTVTIYAIITLWYDEHLPMKERLSMSAYVPVAYFVFYIMDVIQVVAIFRCALKIWNRDQFHNTGSTWKSPKRLGDDVQIVSTALPVASEGAVDD